MAVLQGRRDHLDRSLRVDHPLRALRLRPPRRGRRPKANQLGQSQGIVHFGFDSYLVVNLMPLKVNILMRSGDCL